MAQNISLWGASYSDVPAVELPKTGGGTASFTDVTSTTATASDVEQGKYFFTASGVYTEGTATGGGGGGAEYETGTWSPQTDVNRGEVSFVNSHNSAPSIVVIADATGTALSTNYSAVSMVFVRGKALFGAGLPYNTTRLNDDMALFTYRGTGTASSGRQLNINDGDGNDRTYSSYWATNEKFFPYCDSTSYYWRSSRTYKWIAIWKQSS